MEYFPDTADRRETPSRWPGVFSSVYLGSKFISGIFTDALTGLTVVRHFLVDQQSGFIDLCTGATLLLQGRTPVQSYFLI